MLFSFENINSEYTIFEDRCDRAVYLLGLIDSFENDFFPFKITLYSDNLTLQQCFKFTCLESLQLTFMFLSK